MNLKQSYIVTSSCPRNSSGMAPHSPCVMHRHTHTHQCIGPRSEQPQEETTTQNQKQVLFESALVETQRRKRQPSKPTSCSKNHVSSFVSQCCSSPPAIQNKMQTLQLLCCKDHGMHGTLAANSACHRSKVRTAQAAQNVTCKAHPS